MKFWIMTVTKHDNAAVFFISVLMIYSFYIICKSENVWIVRFHIWRSLDNKW